MVLHSKHDMAQVIGNKGEIKLMGYRRGNLYYVNNVSRPECTYNLDNINYDLRCRHERLRHLNAKDVAKLLGKLADITEVRNLRDCDICARGKKTALPFFDTRVPPTDKLYIAHTGIVVLMKSESIGGAKYLCFRFI